jgi:chromosome segregation ATPase
LPQLHLRAQAQSQALAQVTKLREELFRVVLELGENAEELARQEHELAELETQRQRLLSLQSRLAAADLSLLRRQVADLANSLGPAQDELAQLEIALTQQETLHTELQQAIAVARNILQSNRQDIATSLSRLTELATAWRRRSVTLNERYTAQAAQVVEEIEEAVAEEIRLKQELTAQWAKSDAFASNISELSDSLRFYAENGRRIAVSIPATFETTRERLKEVEGVLALIDDDLKKALTRHQRAGDLLEKIT